MAVRSDPLRAAHVGFGLEDGIAFRMRCMVSHNGGVQRLTIGRIPSMSTIDFLHDNVASFIHSEARIEGAGCTFADTQEIISYGRTTGATDQDIQIVIGLKHAWEYLFEHYTEPVSFEHFANYNFFVQQGYRPRGGEIRTENITISNTDYVPVPHSVDEFYNVIGTACDGYNSYSNQALTMLFMLCKHQFFWDGNKRSSQLLVNHYLANQDSGIYLMIPEGNEEQFHEDLIQFYEGNMSLDDVTWLDNYIWAV